MHRRLSLLSTLFASGCAVTGFERQHYQSALGGPSYAPSSSLGYDPGRPLNHAQGWIGVTELNIDNLDIDPSLGSADGSTSTEMPLIGGAMQFPFVGKRRIHFGIEGGFSFGFRSNIEAFAFGSNGAVVVTDNDVFLTDLFLGAYSDADLGQSFRIYGGVGPVLQFGSIDYDYQDPVLGQVRVNDDGFGTGYYGRVGFEFKLSPASAIGMSYRYVDSNLDFGGLVHGMDLEQDQYMVTFTESY